MQAFNFAIDKKKPNNQNQKETKQNINFLAQPILNIFFQKFHGLVLG